MGVVPHLCLFLACLAGVSSAVVPTQPASEIVKPGQSYKLTCAVGFDLKKRNVHWVRMASGKELEWLAIVWTANKPDYVPALRDRLIASKSGTSVFLEMKDLKVEDTAVYYCAIDGGAPIYHGDRQLNRNWSRQRSVCSAVCLHGFSIAASQSQIPEA